MPSNMTLSLLITASAGAAVAALRQVGQRLDGLKTKATGAQAVHGRLGEAIAEVCKVVGVARSIDRAWSETTCSCANSALRNPDTLRAVAEPLSRSALLTTNFR